MSKQAKKRTQHTSALLPPAEAEEEGYGSSKVHLSDQSTTASLSLKRKITFIIIIVSILSPFLYLYHQRTTHQEQAYRLSLKEYNNLLERAHVLLEQYQDLTGQHDLPEHLRLRLPSEADLQAMKKKTEMISEPVESESNNAASVAAEEEQQQVEEAPETLQVIEGQSTEVVPPPAVGKVDPNRGSKRDIILGMAQDIDPKNLAVFCGSLRKVSDATDVVLFVNKPVSPKNKEIASTYNIKLVEFEVSDLPERMQGYHPSTSRWLLFYQYLTRNPKYRMLYNRVWMVDVRDTYFQADPFTFVDIKSPSFHIFHGQEAFPISQCGWNSGWIKDCFGQAMLNQVGKNTIICSGVSVGTIDLVLDYLLMMSQVVQGKAVPHSSNYLEEHIVEQFSDEYKALVQNRKAIKHQFPKCERNGVDQGLHNVLVYNNAIPKMMKWDQSSGPVANMQAKVARIRKEADNELKVYNRQNQLSAVVHQYDRNTALQQFLFERYVTWMNVNDLQGEWQQDQDCQAYTYELDKDLYKGKCDLKMRGGATSAVSCCKYCNEAQGCVAFTYSAGVCFLKSCTTINPSSSHEITKGLVSGHK